MNLIYETTEQIGDGPKVTRKYRVEDMAYMNITDLFRNLKQLDEEKVYPLEVQQQDV